MTIHELIKLAIKKLPLGNNTSPALDGEVLLSYVLAKPKEYLLANPKKKVDPKLEKKFLTLINRRILGWPVAYLTKSKDFFGLNFYVDKSVLIPRPETEGLVELAINSIKDLRFKIKGRPLRILDLGTGSGNIIISIAKTFQHSQEYKNIYFASDISAKAINVAKKNAAIILGKGTKKKIKITFADGNLLEPWRNERFDIIVANLPYLAKLVDPSTKLEPKGALIAAKKGLKLYQELFQQLTSLSSYPSVLLLEIGRDQGLPIKKLAKKILPAYKTKISKDLFSRDRYAKLVRHDV